MNIKILEIIAKVSKKSVTDVELELGSEGLWDSFSHLELVLALEEEFNIMLEPEEIAEMKTPKLVLETISNKVN